MAESNLPNQFDHIMLHIKSLEYDCNENLFTINHTTRKISDDQVSDQVRYTDTNKTVKVNHQKL